MQTSNNIAEMLLNVISWHSGETGTVCELQQVMYIGNNEDIAYKTNNNGR